MNSVAPACEILNLLCIDDTCGARLNHSIEQMLERGHLDEARVKAQQSVHFCVDVTDNAAFGRSVGHLLEAIIAHAGGDLQDAHEYYRQARTGFRATVHNWNCWHEAVACLGLGLVAKAQRRWSEALRYFDDGLHTLARAHIRYANAGWLVAMFNRRILEIQDLVARQAPNNDGIPIVGITAAGPPLPAVEIDAEEAQWNALHLGKGLYGIKKDLESRWSVSSAMYTHGNYFAVAVEGDSMLNAGITSGDYVIFRRQATADNGQIVVVRIDYLTESRSTVKRFYRRDGKIVLKADNPAYEPQEILFEQGDPGVNILGRVVAIAAQKS